MTFKLSLLLTFLPLAACMSSTPAPYTYETAAKLSDNHVGIGTLCGEIERARGVDVGNEEYDWLNKPRLEDDLDILIAEYKKRHPKTSKKWLNHIRNGIVEIGMPEREAACSWNMFMENEVVTARKHIKLYDSSYYFFYVNGRTGKVISFGEY